MSLLSGYSTCTCYAHKPWLACGPTFKLRSRVLASKCVSNGDRPQRPLGRRADRVHRWSLETMGVAAAEQSATSSKPRSDLVAKLPCRDASARATAHHGASAPPSEGVEPSDRQNAASSPQHARGTTPWKKGTGSTPRRSGSTSPAGVVTSYSLRGLFISQPPRGW
jgi:hypothetical protein